jgi:RNA repair, ligase-Pnkp-associating, region of Hen1
VLVTLSTTHVPATDLGFLLHKNPARAQRVEVSTGMAHVFYPEANEHRCTAALLLEVDPIGLVRTARAGGGEGRPSPSTSTTVRTRRPACWPWRSARRSRVPAEA